MSVRKYSCLEFEGVIFWIVSSIIEPLNAIMPEFTFVIIFCDALASLSSMIASRLPVLEVTSLPYPDGFSALNPNTQISEPDLMLSSNSHIISLLIKGVSAYKTRIG